MPKTLLLADDSVVIQKLVGLSFANEDVEVITTDNGDDALAEARRMRPDLVLADVVMPGQNGYEVCGAIKADAALRHIPVLLLTGTFEAFDEVRARQVGADGHITKPFEAQALVDRVTDLLARTPEVTAPAPALLHERNFALRAGDSREETPPAREASSYDFFDDDDVRKEFSEPQPVTASPSPLSPMNSDDAFDFGSDLDPIHSEPDLLDANFEFASDPHSDLTMAMLLKSESLPPADSPLAPSPQPSAMNTPGATPIWFDERAAQDESSAAPRTPESPREASLVAPPPSIPNTLSTPDASPASGVEPVLDFGFDEPGEAPALATPILGTDQAFGSPGLLQDIGSAFDDLGAGDPLEIGLSSLDDPADPIHSTYDVSTSDLGDPFTGSANDSAAREPTPSPRLASETGLEPPSTTRGPNRPDVSPLMRDRIHETLEKIAWEAFADVSDSIVRQVLERVESIVWEVVPQMAEALIQEEIRRMKGDD
jgi:CheY-like chemotaxis protein